MATTSESRFANSYKDSQHPKYYVVNEWFNRKKSLLLTLSVVSITLLVLLHLTIITVQIVLGSISEKFVMLTTIALISIIAISVIWKGVSSIAIYAIGLTLTSIGILFPIYSVNMVEVHYRASYGFATEQSIFNASHGYFFQGIGMIVFSIIIGYKPGLLYIRNRPKPSYIVWEKYPI